MTPAHKAKLEQVAREWLIGSGFCHRNYEGELTPVRADVDALVGLLASQQAAVLEEAAAVNEALILEHDVGAPGISVLQVAACRIRQLAQERRL